MNELKIATRLKLSLGLLAATLVAVAALALWQMGVMRASTQEITTNWMPSVKLINQMNTNTSEYRIGEVSHVLSTDDKQRAVFEKEIAAVKANFDRNRDAYVKLISSDEERKIYESFAADWTLYLQMHEGLIEASRKNDTDRARALLDQETKPVYDRFSATLVKLIELNHNGSVGASKASGKAYTAARNSMVVSILVSLAVVLAAAVWLIRATIRPMGTTVRNNADSALQTNALAQGASAIAEQGGEVVGKVVTTTQGINETAAARSASSARSTQVG